MIKTLNVSGKTVEAREARERYVRHVLRLVVPVHIYLFSRERENVKLPDRHEIDELKSYHEELEDCWSTVGELLVA